MSVAFLSHSIACIHASCMLSLSYNGEGNINEMAAAQGIENVTHAYGTMTVFASAASHALSRLTCWLSLRSAVAPRRRRLPTAALFASPVIAVRVGVNIEIFTPPTRVAGRRRGAAPSRRRHHRRDNDGDGGRASTTPAGRWHCGGWRGGGPRRRVDAGEQMACACALAAAQ